MDETGPGGPGGIEPESLNWAGGFVTQSGGIRPGLRERKKARTRSAIQQQALVLFERQGYETTTIEQIADEADVSPSTVLRYFPTKDALVLDDDYDLPIMEALRSQPIDIDPILAVRTALRTGFGAISAEDLSRFRVRQRLAFTVPQLRAAGHVRLSQSIDTLADFFAERSGRHRGDLEVRVVAGAIIGVILSAMLDWANNPESDPLAVLDASLAQLQAGFPEPAARQTGTATVAGVPAAQSESRVPSIELSTR